MIAFLQDHSELHILRLGYQAMEKNKPFTSVFFSSHNAYRLSYKVSGLKSESITIAHPSC